MGWGFQFFVAMWRDECSTNFSKSALATNVLVFKLPFLGSLMEEQGMHEGDGGLFVFWRETVWNYHSPEVILTADFHPTRDPLDVRELLLILAKTKSNVMETKLQYVAPH